MRKVLPKNASVVPKHAVRVFKGVIFDTYQWQQQVFDGTYRTFEMVKRPDTVNVIAVRDGKIVILEQEQPGDGPYYDLPGGRHDVETEDELDAIKRELLEETGLRFKTWKLIDLTQSLPKVEQFWYIFLATDFESEGPQNLDAGEKITVEYRDFSEVKKLLATQKAQYFPKDLLEKVNSIDDLLNLPEYTGV